MKKISIALSAPLFALAACNSGGGAGNNVQANAVDANAIDANAIAPLDNGAAPAENVATGKPTAAGGDAVPAGKPTGDAPAGGAEGSGGKPPAEPGNEQ